MSKSRKVVSIPNAPEEWRNIEGTNIYVSNLGRAKRIWKNGKETLVGFFSKRDNEVMIKLNKKDVRLKRLVWNAFRGEIPKGYCLAHKNGINRCNEIYNLYLTKPKLLGLKTGHLSKSQKVIDKTNNVVYRSARTAGKYLYCSYQTIMDICNGKRKKPMFDVYWWDEESERYYRGKWRKNYDNA